MIGLNRLICLICLSTLLLLYGVSNAIGSGEKGLTPNLETMAREEIRFNIVSFANSTALSNIEKDHAQTLADHQRELMSITERGYNVQYWMTIGIFFIVSGLVIGGFILSYLQFKADIAERANSDDGDKASIKVSKSGIEFSSSVIGLVVLFMSFMFFYLYVKDVYTEPPRV